MIYELGHIVKKVAKVFY